MKIMLKKMLKFCVPNGLIWLRRKFVKRIPNMIYSPSQRGGLSPVKVSFPPPPNVIPDKMFKDYTMNGKINVLYAYSDDRVLDDTQIHNTPMVYKRVFRLLSRGKFPYYGAQGKAFFDALLKYPLKDKNVMIWGLAGCNCEALAVWGGGGGGFILLIKTTQFAKIRGFLF
jgi:hypothetical protein